MIERGRRIFAPRSTVTTLGVLAAAIVVMAVSLVVQQPLEWPFATALLLVAALIVVRGLPAGVELQTDVLVVHDYAAITRIRRDQIVSVARFPAIEWSSADGTSRETLVSAFTRRPGIAGPSDEDRAAVRTRIEAWLAADTGRDPANQRG
jgi:hypothetical protein